MAAHRSRSTRASFSGNAIFVIVMPPPLGRATTIPALHQATRPTADTRHRRRSRPRTGPGPRGLAGHGEGADAQVGDRSVAPPRRSGRPRWRSGRCCAFASIVGGRPGRDAPVATCRPRSVQRVTIAAMWPVTSPGTKASVRWTDAVTGMSHHCGGRRRRVMKGEALVDDGRRSRAASPPSIRSLPTRARDAPARHRRHEYLDFTGGISVLDVGHLHPRVVTAVTEPLEHFSHTCFQVAMGRLRGPGRAAERRRARRLPRRRYLFRHRVEAVENASDRAGLHNRPTILSFTHSFHGRTLIGMTLTADPRLQPSFGPSRPRSPHALPVPVSRVDDRARARGAGRPLPDSRRARSRRRDIDRPRARGGRVVAASPDFLRALRRVTDGGGCCSSRRDPVRDGPDRPHACAVEHAGVVPDLETNAGF